jgi:hypothetical protein
LVGGLVVGVLALALVLGGLGAGLAISSQGGPKATVTTTETVGNSTAPYKVTILIATDSIFNATAQDQPAYFVVGPDGLLSSSSIKIPVNRTIELTIINYDDGNASLNFPNDNVVSGTVGNRIFVASNDNINSTQGASQIVVRGGETVSSLDPSQIAHTFTVPSLKNALNVPVPVSSTVVAFFKVTKAGTYAWFCMTDCGDAAMSTPGWMRGNLVAS